MFSTASDRRTISVMRLRTGCWSEKSSRRMLSVLRAMRAIERERISEAASAPSAASATAMAAAAPARCRSTRDSAVSSKTGTAAPITKRCPSNGGMRWTITR